MTTRLAEYRVAVDWLDVKDRAFAGTYDDVTAYVLGQPSLTVVGGRDKARATAPPQVGTGTLALKNDDQRFSNEYVGSPLYQQVRPGHDVEIAATYGGDGIAYDADLDYDADEPYDGVFESILFSGVIDEPTQNPARAVRNVGLTLVSRLSLIRGLKGTTPLYTSISTGAAIAHVLDLAGWPAELRDLDDGETTLAYWALNDADLYAELLKLVASEGAGAVLVERGDGVIFFGSRNHRGLDARSTESQVTIYDTSESQEIAYDADVAYDEAIAYDAGEGIRHVGAPTYTPGFRDIFNICTIPTVRRSTASLAVVWTYGTTFSIGAGLGYTITAETDDPFTAAVCANGVDVTASSGSIASVTLSRTSGYRTEITITAGGGGATVNLLQLRAQALPVAAKIPVAQTQDTSDSIAANGERSFSYVGLEDITAAQAQDLADVIIQRYQEPRPIVEFTLVNRDAATLYYQLTLQVSDRVTVVERHTGYAIDVYIDRIQHRIDSAGLLHYTTYWCEKVVDETATYVYDDAGSTYGTAVYGA